MADREAAKEKAAKLLKKRGSQSTINSEIRHTAHSTHVSKYHVTHSSVSNLEDKGHEDSKPQQKYENTYQLTASKKFPGAMIKNILKDVLESYLVDHTYDPEICRQMTKTLSEVVKARVKELQIPRFKVITLITIGSSNDQGMTVGSRCLWDASVDMFSSFEYKNKHLFAVGTVYGVYAE
ncbi:dynein light chain Tctex-type 5-B-like [Watersipora subatra]|uniref:dynein light chain Tctex-type 5-B-like n=1 Tax=Watersipora subatra TaxID=2589382 RepID=UPI00355B0FA7